jgi:ubiquinone/menaquinone biosynthesis C-methylase UbiE
MSHEEFPYLHGFSPQEQARLQAQARFGEQLIYQNVDFSNHKKILEIGSGVGAQTEILLRRFPDIHVTCVDLNPHQIQAAQKFLGQIPNLQNRFEIHQMSADNLELEPLAYDGAFICWLLEHVPDPGKVLSEARRVLRPGADIVITEVMNSSFFLDPYSPHVWKYWMAFNDFQHDHAGDPFIGAKLGNLLNSVGFRDIKTEVKTWHFDNRQPQRRKVAMEYWYDLLFSADEILIKEKATDVETVKKAKEEMKAVAKDPNAVLFYSFMQATAKVGWSG